MPVAAVIDKNGDIHVTGLTQASGGAQTFTATIDLMGATVGLPHGLPDANYGIVVVPTAQSAGVLAGWLVTTKGTRTVVITFNLVAAIAMTVTFELHIYPTK